MVRQIADLLKDVQHKKPLVHHITNYVTVNDCANVTLAIGASPIMADEVAEVAQITSISASLVLNMGTLNQRTVKSMIAAGKEANSQGIPVIFDPVGAGASNLRNQTAKMILKEIKCSVIRGNISEIRYLAGENAKTKGVDASEGDLSDDITESIEVAKSLAKKYNCVVAITGATDIISDGIQTISINNGHQMLGSVTGTGCMCTSLIASFSGATSNYLLAAAAGILTISIAGEIAFDRAGKAGLGSYHMAIIDEISKLSDETICRRATLNETYH